MALTGYDLSAIEKILQNYTEPIKEDLDGLRQDVSTLRENMGMLREDVGTLHQNMSTLQQDVGMIKQDVGTLQQDVAELKKGQKKMQSDLTTVINKFDHDILNLRKRVTVVEAKLEIPATEFE